MRVREVVKGDRDGWVRMRSDLWPDGADEHAAEIDDYFRGGSVGSDQVFVCEADGSLVGFIELRIRDYAEGSYEPGVPYVEGWYVTPDARARGVGGSLMREAERWAKASGYSELASDAEIENASSIAAHEALGFEEVARSVCFLKRI